MIRRRHIFAAGVTAPFVARTQSRGELKIVPEGDLPILDPVFTTATIVRNHGYRVWDTLYGMDAEYQMQPQMLAGHSIEDDGRRWILTLPVRDRRSGARLPRRLRALRRLRAARGWACHIHRRPQGRAFPVGGMARDPRRLHRCWNLAGRWP